MIEPRRIFSTKKLSPRLLKDLQYDAYIAYDEADFIRTEISEPALVEPLPSGEILLIFTSPQAVSATARLYPQLRTASVVCYCLEGATRLRVEAIFPQTRVLAAAEAAKSLAAVIIDANPVGSLLFFCSDRRHDALPDELRASGLMLEERQVYRTLLQPLKLQGPVDGLLFFSPSAVESFLQLNRVEPGTACFAIGKTTASAVQKYTGCSAFIAARPTQEALLTTVLRYFKINICVPTQK